MTLLASTVLLEGITHIEDLPLQQFIRTVESLKDKIISEKLDGANLWMGVDDQGFFTSREGKSPKKARFYSVRDYAMVASYNAFRAAHLALEKMQGTITKILKSGDMVEVEVLFGRQPNTVTYGVADKNFIVILRGVSGTPDERVQALSNALNGKSVTVESTIVSSPDGSALELNDEKLVWEFTKVAPLPAKKLNTKEAMSLLAGLKAFMAEKNEVLGMTNEQVAELSLTSVPKEKREEAKKERERVNAQIMNDFKNPIKELLLNNFVRKIKPFLQDKNLHPSEDIGVEGVVVRDPVSGSQTKIVDKDVFTAINTFNNIVRGQIGGLVKTTDQEAPIESRGGAFGEAKIRIAELLGAKELAMSSGTKRFITKFKGKDMAATALAVAKSLNITSLPNVRTKISSILKNTIVEVDKILHSFKKEAGEYKLKLKTGKEIGITPEVMKRTLTAFAETKKDIAEINARVLASRTSADLVIALYGRTIESIFDSGDTEVKESFSLIKMLEDDAGAAAPAAGGAPPVAPGGTVAGPVTDTVSASTKAGNIAALPFRLGAKGSKVIIKRPRTFQRPKKFPAPQASVPKMEGKFSLLKSMNEEWAHLNQMKFATDVDDTAQANNDVEFNQLRNNVNIGDNVTQMDVNRYLDKAHDLNDEVDSVTFGMENDDGSVIKVYVNASQADDFENALASLLGKEDDAEEVINQLANKFDIVDVEWPKEMQSPAAGEQETDILPTDDTEVGGSGDLGDSGESEDGLDLSTASDEGEQTPAETETGAEDETSTEPSDEEGEESSGEEGEGEESSSEEEPAAEKEERDEFGQIIKKKKKTEESISAIFKNKRLLEDTQSTGDQVTAMMTSLGIDPNSNKSISAQLKELKPKQALQKAGNNSKFKSQLQSINASLGSGTKPAASAGPTSSAIPSSLPPQFNSHSILGDIVAEESAGGKWIFGKMGESGLMIKAKGMTIKIDDEQAEKLHIGLEASKTVSVVTTHDKRFVFKPSEESGYNVFERGDDAKFPDGLAMAEDQVDELLDLLSEK